jgi:hypothetical protein
MLHSPSPPDGFGRSATCSALCMPTTEPALPSPASEDADPASAFADLNDADGGWQAGTATLPPIIDLEASGFGRDSYPIEVGFVLEDGRTGCTLIRPEPGWTHWDGAAERVHGITQAVLLDRGRSVAEVARWLNDHLRGRTVYTDAWAHDYPWLARIFDAAGVVPRFRVGHLRTLLDDEQALAWHSRLLEVRGHPRPPRHRASVDAREIRAALALTLGSPHTR